MNDYDIFSSFTDVIDDPLRGSEGEKTETDEATSGSKAPGKFAFASDLNVNKFLILHLNFCSSSAPPCLSPPSFAARKGALTLMTSSRAEIADGVGDLADSLFWALESRCIDASLNRQPTLPMAPFEKKEFVGVDADSR